MKSSYLVTGGAGFIGSHTVDALVAAGNAVVVLDIVPHSHATNLSQSLNDIEYIEGDITDLATMRRASEGKDFIIHLAADVSVPASIENPVDTHNTNVNGTLNVLKAAEEAQVKRVVFASSAAVYGDAAQVPVSEEQTLNPMSPYALHKHMNEQYAEYFSRRGIIETVGLRYFNVFGPRQDPSSPYSGVISLCCKHLQAGTEFTVFGDGEQTRDFVSVHDVVQANMLACTQGKPGEIFNVATGTEVSLSTLIEEMNNLSDKKLLVSHKPAREGDIKKSCASIEKAITALGYSPKFNRRTALAELIAGGHE